MISNNILLDIGWLDKMKRRQHFFFILRLYFQWSHHSLQEILCTGITCTILTVYVSDLLPRSYWRLVLIQINQG